MVVGGEDAGGGSVPFPVSAIALCDGFSWPIDAVTDSVYSTLHYIIVACSYLHLGAPMPGSPGSSRK